MIGEDHPDRIVCLNCGAAFDDDPSCPAWKWDPAFETPSGLRHLCPNSLHRVTLSDSRGGKPPGQCVRLADAFRDLAIQLQPMGLAYLDQEALGRRLTLAAMAMAEEGLATYGIQGARLTGLGRARWGEHYHALRRSFADRG